ncbi:retrovirus-related pol polyprotein from transposon TNT 1-94 [Tanacetum coccineum]
MEPKKLIEALEEEGWIIVMQEELNQFEKNKEGIDYEETFAPVARLEAIKIFLAYEIYMGFIVYQMDVNSAFLNEKISEEVYVQQPHGFESNEFPNHVCKLDKALYGLKQAPGSWYETLSKFIIQHKFDRGTIDITLFTYKTKSDVIIVHIYMDDIIFRSTGIKPSKQFGKLMTKKYEMSMMGELTYFLGFQIKQDFKGISIYQEKYVKDLLKKYDLADSALVKCPMLFLKKLSPDESGVSVNETLFRGMIGSLMYLTASRLDIQFSTCLCARYQANPKESHLVAKEYLKGLQILGGKLVCWSAKKQSSVAMSSAEAEYVPIFCDNTSAIAISNNPVLHSRIKHIDIRYHFIRDYILKGVALLEHSNNLYHPMLSFLSNGCISTALSRQPSATYVEYLKEFWYTAEVDEATETITFSLSSVEKPLSFTQDEFISTIGLPVYTNVVPLPPQGDLAKLFQEAEQSLILSSKKVNADDGADKPSSKTTVQPVTQPKAPTDLKLKKKKIPPSSKPKSSHKVRVILPKKQVADTQPADDIK